MTMRISLLVLLATLLAASVGAGEPDAELGETLDPCHVSTTDKEHWLEIRKNVDDVDGSLVAPRLVDCLRSADSTLRDHIGYEVLTYWLRGGKLSKSVKRDMTFVLQEWLLRTAPLDSEDPAIGRAFSALVLSEIVRADAVKGFLTDQEIGTLAESAAQMFASERDYRGLDPDLGWIHTVAHGSDLLWQLSLHPRLTATRLKLLLDSIASQLTETTPPPFVFNEADRIARAVAAIAARSEMAPDHLIGWLGRIADPGDLGSWNQAFSSIDGMGKLHNTKQFLRAL